MPTDRALTRPVGDQRLALLAALVCGVILAVQSRLNGELGIHVGAMPAAWISFGTGLLAISVLWLTRRFRSGVATLRRALRGHRLAPWQLLGGIAGGLLVASQTYAVPLVGVATFLIALVGGQTVNALLVDRLGWGPAAPQSITPARLAASGLAVIGVVIAVAPGAREGGFVLLPIVLTFVIGMATAVQQATNAQVTVASGDASVTAFINFSVGMLTLLVMGSWSVLRGGWPDPTGVPWWDWWGGVIGAIFLVLAAWAVVHTGVLLFGLVTITSQLGTGVALDLLDPASRDRVGEQMLIGIGLTVVAAVWAARARARSRRAARSLE